MRALILALALLAIGKIWFQDNLYRSGTEEALVAAYRARAAEACAKSVSALQLASVMEKPVDWVSDAAARVTVGNPAVPVHVWQLDHDQWNARFRQPYLTLQPSSSNLSCAYDLLADKAEITRS